MSAKKRKSTPVDSKPNNFLALTAVVVLGIVAISDLFSPNDVQGFIYFGLIGAALGAKFEDIFSIGGKK